MQFAPFEIVDRANPEKIELDNYHDHGPIGSCSEVDLNYLD